MKITLCVLFLAANLFLGSAAAKDQTIGDLQIKIVEVSASGKITVEVSNVSKKPIKVWRDWNSWGAARWRVLRIRKGQLETFFQNPNQAFTRNGPTFNQIAVGTHIKQKLDLNGGHWCGFGHCSQYDREDGLGGQKVSFEPDDIIVVTYDVPNSEEALNMGVWHGVAAALTTAP